MILIILMCKIVSHTWFYFPKDEHNAVHQQTVSSLIMKHSAEMKALQAKLQSQRQEELTVLCQVTCVCVCVCVSVFSCSGVLNLETFN